MNLRPAIKTPHGLVIGEVSDSHKLLMKKNNIEDVEDDHKGFSPNNGKMFLDRIQAVEFLKKYEPFVYKKVKDEVGEGLHTHVYAKAKGVEMEQEEPEEEIQKIEMTPEFEEGISEL